jgi:alkylation response protein AidB-like acyl-CoA dehydrogenase
MRFEESVEDVAFRSSAREWLRAHVPHEPRPRSGPAARAFDLEWQRVQFEGGWAGVSWPVEYGGLGLPAHLQVIWYEEYARAGGPELGASFVGLNHGGPTLIACGTEAQKQRYLPAILEGRELWCQGFSEPDAGSDLASLRTRAVLDADEFVVTGQKIWTSYADLADHQELLVRTDGSGRKHDGITWLIADMQTPGIEVRPIDAIGGEPHFAEVFYDGARIPVSNVVGEIDRGWQVTLTTLSFERGTAFIAEQMRLASVVRDLVALARVVPSSRGRGTAIDDDAVRATLGRLLVAVEALRAMTFHLVSKTAAATGPLPDGSLIRIWFSTLAQEVSRVAFELRGWSSIDGTITDAGIGAAARDWTHEYLWSFQETIGGGTVEIQKNIVGERMLGLPR